MQKKTILLVSGAVLTLILCGVGLAVYLFNKPHLNAGNLAPAFRVDATTLFREFSRDEAAADRKFVDKIIEIKGVILSREESDRTISVLLDTGNPAAAVNCSFRYSGTGKINMPSKGGMVTIKGKCAGFLNDVNVVDCVLE
jgi:hypothetical protein